MMIDSKPVFRLVLHPEKMNFAPESWRELRRLLAESEFLGKAYEVDAVQRYFIGEKFLQMVTFMGCSPHIELTPAVVGQLDFCHVAFSDIYAFPHFRCHERDVFARCPECGRRDQNWPEFIRQWEQAPIDTQYQCPSCEAMVHPQKLRWRNTAGIARLFIDIYSVFPNEGVPTQQLLSLLKQASGEDWTYFYTNR